MLSRKHAVKRKLQQLKDRLKRRTEEMNPSKTKWVVNHLCPQMPATATIVGDKIVTKREAYS